MYKRRDWLYMHGADGGGSDTDSDSSQSKSQGKMPPHIAKYRIAWAIRR